jgi:hypothetical protein
MYLPVVGATNVYHSSGAECPTVFVPVLEFPETTDVDAQDIFPATVIWVEVLGQEVVRRYAPDRVENPSTTTM